MIGAVPQSKFPLYEEVPEREGFLSDGVKIEYLINSVRETPEGTKFIRNGTEYSAEKAAEHLRTKYKNGKKYAGTVECFIENIASRSSLNGKEYIIKFPDGKTVPAREFFTEELGKIN